MVKPAISAKGKNKTMVKISGSGPSSSSSSYKISGPSSSSLLEKMERLKAKRNLPVDTAKDVYDKAMHKSGIPFVMQLTVVNIAEATNVPDDKKGNPRQAVNVLLTDKNITMEELRLLTEEMEVNASMEYGIGLEDVMVKATIWGVDVDKVEDAIDIGQKIQILNHTKLSVYRQTACFNTQLTQVSLL